MKNIVISYLVVVSTQMGITMAFAQDNLSAECEAFKNELAQRLTDFQITYQELQQLEAASKSAKLETGGKAITAGVAYKAAKTWASDGAKVKAEHMAHPAKTKGARFVQWLKRFKIGTLKWSAYGVAGMGLLTGYTSARGAFTDDDLQELKTDIDTYIEWCLNVTHNEQTDHP